MSQPRLTLEDLYEGNQKFIKGTASTGHVRLDKQSPPFLLFNCADSRLPGSQIFSVPLGSIFTSANIANQFNEQDLNTKSILSFAVDNLGVDHIIVMGHYGCGGVAAAMASPPPDPLTVSEIAIHEYISPIRRIYRTSERAEIVSHRNSQAPIPSGAGDQDFSRITYSEEPVLKHAVYALIEENVKKQVGRIATSELMTERFNNNVSPVFIHGFVYELTTGQVFDLGVSVGPPGVAPPPMPFPRAP